MPSPSPADEQASLPQPPARTPDRDPTRTPDRTSVCDPEPTALNPLPSGTLTLEPLAPSTPAGGLLPRLARVIGIDRAIAFTVLARGWSSLAGLVTLALIARFLSPAEQGFYYTFYPLVNLQIILELGFSVVILQTASHEAAHLHFASVDSVSGPALHLGRLASTLRKALRWYSLASLVLLAILLPAGEHFFRAHTTPATAAVPWRAPWLLAALATACTFQIDPLFSFLEGCGQVPQVARARLAQAITGSLLGWGALRLHHGLFAPGCIIGGQALAGAVFLLIRRPLFRNLLRVPIASEARISWRTDLWPFQWRMAISWICGYFTFQLATPVLFARWGAVEAGRMGMSLNIAGSLSAVAVAWMNTKAAPFGQLIALRRFPELDRRFRAALTQSTSICLLGSLAVLALDLLLRHLGHPFAHRLLAPLPLALLLASSLCNIVVSAEAMYLRAHKQEKFMLNSIVGALYTAPMILLLGRLYGATGIAAGSLVGAVLIGLGFGTWTFQHYRRLWHA